MQYASLDELIRHSSSSRKYFVSLPVEIQLELHRQKDYIHNARDLRFYADNCVKYNAFCSLSDSLLN